MKLKSQVDDNGIVELTGPGNLMQRLNLFEKETKVRKTDPRDGERKNRFLVILFEHSDQALLGASFTFLDFLVI